MGSFSREGDEDSFQVIKLFLNNSVLQLAMGVDAEIVFEKHEFDGKRYKLRNKFYD